MASAQYGSLPFDEAIRFFQGKKLVPTERWADVWKEGHDAGFMVAGAMKADLLGDFHSAIRKARKQGTTLAEFKKDFESIIAKHGWTGWTGETTEAGRAWRAKTIYDTNLQSSYQAGLWAQIEAVKDSRPYLLYRHSDASVTPRPLHKSWDGLVVRQDDPWVQAHFPPNGFGCKCTMFALNDRDLKRMGKDGPDTPPDNGSRIWVDKATGEMHRIPNGIDPGFDYAPGASRTDLLRQQLGEKAKALPGDLGKDLQKDLAATTKTKAKAFEPQATAKAAASYAMENDLVDFADYGSVKPEVANAWNQSLFEHIAQFPELRKNQRFAGTCQGQFSRWYRIALESRINALMAAGVGRDEAEATALRMISKRKVPGERFAHSWAQEDVAGIAVNEKWGKNPAGFQKALAVSVYSGFHPEGCDTIKSVADHELGHQLDDLLGLRTDPELAAYFAQLGATAINTGLSRYASTNIAEFIAEAWAEYRNNPAPRPIAQRIGGIVEARYRSRKDSPR
jgi:hypothetical protein